MTSHTSPPDLSSLTTPDLQETYIEIQTEHLPQLLLRMVCALTSHLQTLGLGELTQCLRLCSKILSKVQPPLVSPLALPQGSATATAAVSPSTPTPTPTPTAAPPARDSEDKRVRNSLWVISKDG